MTDAEPLVAGEQYEVEIELEATAWRWQPGRTLRLAVTGADWPNTVGAPRPFTLTVSGGELTLPTYDAAGSPFADPVFTPGDDLAGEDAGGVRWTIGRDVLARRTTASVDHGSSYDATYGSAAERYRGSVSVDTRSWQQQAQAEVEFVLRFDDDGNEQRVECAASSTLAVTADDTSFEVTVELTCREDGTEIATRRWQRSYRRDLA
jgi:hypothetical protein